MAADSPPAPAKRRLSVLDAGKIAASSRPDTDGVNPAKEAAMWRLKGMALAVSSTAALAVSSTAALAVSSTAACGSRDPLLQDARGPGSECCVGDPDQVFTSSITT